MKRFASLFFAAVLGSVSTITAVKYFDDKEDPAVKLEYLSGAPASKVAYKVDEKGNVVPLDFTTAAEKVMPAVVHIRSTQQVRSSQTPGNDPFRDFFGPRLYQGPAQSSGSGVIINENGYIVTNHHVVQDADIVEVTLYDNRTFKADVIGSDPDTDIALVKIAQSGLPYLSFVDSDKAKVGEWVLAVGNPFNLNSTVTAGIISAKGRNINILGSRDSDGARTAIESFIQTDAAINPGNSGGALVELNGGLLGINTAIASNTGSYAGYGFAVPSNIVGKIVEDLIKHGAVQRGWLGVSIGNVNSQVAKEFNLNVQNGAYINGFAANSAAKAAGIQEGDVVVRIDETPIRSSAALTEYIGLRRPGDKVTVVVNRQGKELSFPVVLTGRDGKQGIVKPEEKRGFASLGVDLEEVDEKLLKKLDITNGVRVARLGNGRIARYTEMREGFIITKVDDIPVKSVKDVNEILKKKKPGELITLSGTYEDFPREFNYAFRL